MKKYSIFLLVGVLSITMYSSSLVSEINILTLNEVEAITFMDKSTDENMTMIADSNQTSVENNLDEEPIKFFGIQHAKSGSITEINSTTYILELNDVSDKTILFADRPDRIVLSESTSDFIGNWSLGEDSFAVDAPNAALVLDEQEGQQDIAIIELFNPVYDVENNVLRYEITAENATSIDLPSEFGQSTLGIDC